MPSATRNFFGHLVDRFLPGQNYNSNTGQYSNIGSGIVGAGLRVGASLLGGPVAGAVTGRLVNHYLNNHQGNGNLSMGGPLNAPIPLSPYTFDMHNIGGPSIGQDTGGGYSLNAPIPMQTPTFHMHNIGAPHIGGGGPSQTTNGFTTAFRGGGEMYSPTEFIQALRAKGGNATR